MINNCTLIKKTVQFTFNFYKRMTFEYSLASSI